MNKMDIRAADPKLNREKPKFGKIGLIIIALGTVLSVIILAPRKTLIVIKKIFIYMTAGRHIEMDEDDIIKGD